MSMQPFEYLYCIQGDSIETSEVGRFFLRAFVEQETALRETCYFILVFILLKFLFNVPF